jgi:hypothetical protein
MRPPPNAPANRCCRPRFRHSAWTTDHARSIACITTFTSNAARGGTRVRNDSPQVAAKIRHNYEFLIKLTVASLSLGTTLAHILKRGTAFCARIAEEIWLATPASAVATPTGWSARIVRFVNAAGGQLHERCFGEVARDGHARGVG